MKYKTWIVQVITMLLYCILFFLLFSYDNKYQTPAPYGKEGVYEIKDLNPKRVYFLIDDWAFYSDKLLSPNEVEEANSFLYIGQYPNFQLLEDAPTQATYRMEVILPSNQESMFLQIPEIFSSYRVFVNGSEQVVKTGDLVALQELHNDIVIQVLASTHYYSGMYYPPALGTHRALSLMNRIHDSVYLGLVIFAIFASFLMIFLRKHKEMRYTFVFAKMSMAFAVFLLYPFFHELSSSLLWYVMEDVSYLLMIGYLLRLCVSFANQLDSKLYRKFLKPLMYVMPCGSVIGTLWILPQEPSLVVIYGGFIDAYKFLICFVMLYLGYHIYKKQDVYGIYLLHGGFIFGSSLLLNLYFNNAYEPIYTLWQQEYAMVYLLVLCFVIVILKFRDMMKENEVLTLHLEAEVMKRTQEIQLLLEERKAFFANMAHDLKAPVSAIHMYIASMQENDLYIDSMMSDYITSIEQKNEELLKRITDLNDVTKLDKIKDEFVHISLYELLQQVYEENVPESDVMGIHFSLELPVHDCDLYIVKKKFTILFENIFYNALSFSEHGTRIEVSATYEKDDVIIMMKDQGSGIDAEELPHIFERYYSTRSGNTGHSGLGLAIVNMIALELHGSVWAESTRGVGTTIYLRLPCKAM